MALVLLITQLPVAALPRIAFWLRRDGNTTRDKVNTKRAMFDSPGGHMKSAFGLKIVVPALVLGMAVSAPLFAQDDNNVPASESMHRAGNSAENAASDTGQAIKHAYHGTVTAISDTALTAKVKTALHENKVTKDADIHVNTVAGVVTLKGTVPSAQTAATAQQVAEQTNGVKEVRNELTMGPTASQ
jgi:hyperosmotically inducible periplasmic protein